MNGLRGCVVLCIQTFKVCVHEVLCVCVALYEWIWGMETRLRVSMCACLYMCVCVHACMHSLYKWGWECMNIFRIGVRLLLGVNTFGVYAALCVWSFRVGVHEAAYVCAHLVQGKWGWGV